MKSIDKKIIEKTERLIIKKINLSNSFYIPTESERTILGQKYHWMTYKDIYPVVDDNTNELYAFGKCQSHNHNKKMKHKKKSLNDEYVLMIENEGSINETKPVCFECWNNKDY